MSKKKKVILWLTLLVIAMFFFSYALVPLYNVLCQTLGINGKTNTTAATYKAKPDLSRTVTIYFTASRNEDLNWVFRPNLKKLDIHPGVQEKISYHAKNLTKKEMTVQAIPSVTPGLAAKYLKKIECFCFQQQTLPANKSIDMPMIFYIDPKLPKKIHDITLHYTLFKSIKK